MHFRSIGLVWVLAARIERIFELHAARGVNTGGKVAGSGPAATDVSGKKFLGTAPFVQTMEMNRIGNPLAAAAGERSAFKSGRNPAPIPIVLRRARREYRSLLIVEPPQCQGNGSGTSATWPPPPSGREH